MNEENQVFEQVAHYFGLLADPTRLRILSCLCAEERAVKAVVEKVVQMHGKLICADKRIRLIIQQVCHWHKE